MIIAIDGPAVSGKSSVARMAARRLRLAYIDTGALYRAVGLAVLRRGLSPKNKTHVESCLPVHLKVRYIDDEQHVFLDGEDVSEAIRGPEASMASSDVAKVPAVRDFLLELQRSLARAQSCIVDGRDIGTVVLPNADIKIFLTASAEERARRRHAQYQEKGLSDTYEEVLAAVTARDEQDMNRAIAPLKPAEDSIKLDSTGLEFEETVQAVIDIIHNS